MPQNFQLKSHKTNAADVREGRLFVMSPLPIHDRWKRMIGRFIEAASDETGGLISSFGSSAWFHDGMERAIEADECYYIANEPKVRGCTDTDLQPDPPPDLAIEVDVTHTPVDRLEIYAELGVPELWLYNGKSLRFLHLRDKAYVQIERSIAFAFIAPRDIEHHLSLITSVDEMNLIRTWREWVRVNNAAK
jgi:Uma2 family endonuclease